jgi:hypothetical protein
MEIGVRPRWGTGILFALENYRYPLPAKIFYWDPRKFFELLLRRSASRVRYPLPRRISARPAFFRRSIKPVIQTNLCGVDAVEAVVEYKRPAGHDSPGTRSSKAAGLELIVKADEHVLGLHAPVLGERPFESSADCPRGGGFAARGRNEPIAASSANALIQDRSLGPIRVRGQGYGTQKQRPFASARSGSMPLS